MRAINLQCEYLNNPIGIDRLNPHFCWNCEGGIRQTAYQIICRTENEKIWDTGKCVSSDMTHIRYGGRPLRSKEIVVWEIILWDEQDIPGETSSAWFEMGLLDAKDWSAYWISGDYRLEKNKRYPVDCFKKDFVIKKTVEQARLYISARGLYEARIAGTRVGDFCLAPGSTDYRKRIQYQTYDLTEIISKQKENEVVSLEVELADGWYRGCVAAHGFTKTYGKITSVIFQLEIIYEDGDVEQIVSDVDTLWSNDGPIRFADLKDGEIVDASRRPTFKGKARRQRESIAVLHASNNVISKKKEMFQGQQIYEKSGNKVFDFGQNIAGFLSFKAKGTPGQKITVYLGEMLDEHGEFTQKNIQLTVPAEDYGPLKEIFVISGKSEKITNNLKQTPLQKIEFICSGKEDQYCTKFAIFGFQYALVELEPECEIDELLAIAVYSDMGETGTFICSNKKVNQFYQNTMWSMKGNFLDVPTDCPTRERLGWTGDAQIFFNTASYMMNVASFFKKWMNDVIDAQTKDGKIPAVMPFSRGSVMYNTTGSSVGWADIIYLLPYRFYKKYGDIEFLRECYPAMKKYVKFLLKNTGHKDRSYAKKNPYNKYVYEKGFHLGEWLEPKEFLEDISPDTATKLLHTEECTAYFHYTMRIMEEISAILEETEDQLLYQEYKEGSKNAYNYLFLQTIPDTDRQAKLVRPLALGCVPNEKIDAMVNRLERAVINRNYCVTTGFLSTPFVLKVLTDHHHLELAYKMLENEMAPGWLAEVNSGATTVWEDWQGEASRNHYSPGSVCEWLFDTILGIRLDGKNHFLISPKPGGTLSFAEGNYQSIYGKVFSKWQVKDLEKKVIYWITIPPNTTADVKIGSRTVTVGPGNHEFCQEI